MTDDEIREMIEMFPNLPNPTHYPQTFLYYVNLYRFLKSFGN